MNDDRWFRMCQWIHSNIGLKKFYGLDYIDPCTVQLIHNLSVDEMMGMYSWNNDIVFERDGNNYTLRATSFYHGEMEESHNYYGASWRDVWLQLVMWDRHGMEWKVDVSKWVKA